MRFDGTLKTWNDDRGFGFIEPREGGQDIFVHIKAFGRRTERPQIGERLSFEIELNAQGKKRAARVLPVRDPVAPRRRRNGGPAAWGTASYFAIPAFVLVYLAVAVGWGVPGWVAGVYAAASALCFALYAADKSAAVAGRWRVSESTLIAVGLAGGWPGAIVAQQVLRHKSSKARFRSTFWASVLLNVAGFVAFGIAGPG